LLGQRPTYKSKNRNSVAVRRQKVVPYILKMDRLS